MLNDLLEYRQKRRDEQYTFLAATSTSLTDEDIPLDEVLADLKEGRRAVAKRRRSQYVAEWGRAQEIRDLALIQRTSRSKVAQVVGTAMSP